LETSQVFGKLPQKEASYEKQRFHGTSKVRKLCKSVSYHFYGTILTHFLLVCLCAACLSQLAKSEEQRLKIRHSEKDIMYRAIALLNVGTRGYGLDHAHFSDFMKKYPWKQYLTEDECLFLSDETYNHERPVAPQFYEYKWRTESACTLLWAMGYLEPSELENPAVPCTLLSALDVLEDYDDPIENTRMRPLSEILNMTNFYKGCELSTRSVRIMSDKECADSVLVHPAIVFWRYLALKWLLGMEDW